MSISVRGLLDPEAPYNIVVEVYHEQEFSDMRVFNDWNLAIEYVNSLPEGFSASIKQHRELNLNDL